MSAPRVRADRSGEYRGRAFTAAGRTAANEALHAKSAADAARYTPVLAELSAAGVTSASGIARALNARGIPSVRGGRWQAVQVQRLLARLAD